MVKNLRKTPEDFSPQSFVSDIQNKKDLLQKELDVNLQIQTVLKKRIETVKNFLKSLPAKDPQYGIVHAQIRMDQIELDELQKQEENLVNALKNLG